MVEGMRDHKYCVKIWILGGLSERGPLKTLWIYRGIMAVKLGDYIEHVLTNSHMEVLTMKLAWGMPEILTLNPEP